MSNFPISRPAAAPAVLVSLIAALCWPAQPAAAFDSADLAPETGISEGSFVTASFDGRTVWVPDNPANMLYFKVPGGFDFVVGQPVYVRIEYHDAGLGRLFLEYDSDRGNATADKFKDAELTARSSRVDGSGFVQSYQLLEYPLFSRRQNGGNDFRFQLQNSDGTPVRIAGVRISNTPFPDERFQHVISRPWLQPFEGEVHDFVSPHTLSGKVMTGYQGWFAAPNDYEDNGWVHWGRNRGGKPDAEWMTIDMWPWLEEYEPGNLYRAGDMVYQQDGRPAYLFSSNDPETVQRHFRWMRKHGIDGAYLQHFVSRSSSGYYGAPQFVLDNVMEAASKEGRVWALEYDVSSLDGDPNPFEVITNDWNWLVNEVGILDDPRYLYEDGKPVLFIWGFSVTGRDFSITEANEIVDWFAAQGLYLIAGVNSNWEGNNDPENDWYPHYQKYDQLLAWMEGSRSDLLSQKAKLESWGMKILPHAWPGFSWHNLKQLVYPWQYTARAGGDFYWERIYNAASIGADQIFLGMFDEYDEATAIMPMSDEFPAPFLDPWGWYIDNEGLDPFWYLRLSGAAAEMLNGLRPLTSTLPSGSALTPAAYGGEDATVYLGTTDITAGIVHRTGGDGDTYGSVIEGLDCRINGPDTATDHYFYCDIDDSRVFGNTAGQRATIEVEFYDNYPGTRLRLQYDAVGDVYKQHPDIVNPPASGGWKIARWNVADGYFGNRQNNSSDFRVAPFINETAAIRRISVYFPEEEADAVNGPAPTLDIVNGHVEWPETLDAAGWRLHLTPSLDLTPWPEASPVDYTDGKARYDIDPSSVPTEFYRLERSPRD